MEIDPLESATAVNEGSSNPTAASRLSSWVAITVALLATFLGICKVKDDNIVQAMQQAQADRLDHWSFYQTRNVREEIAKATLVQLELAESSAPVTEQAKYQKAITTYRDLASSQSQKRTSFANNPSKISKPTTHSTIAMTNSTFQTLWSP